MNDDFFPTTITATSPIVEQLRQGLRDQPDHALRAFWQLVERSGTPLVEPIADAPDVRIVTFVWRSGEPLDNVALIENFSVTDPCGTPLEHIARTDVWVRSFVMRSDLRFTYQVAENDALVSVYDPASPPDRFERFLRDPLNPYTADVPFLAELGYAPTEDDISYVELPDATAAQYLAWRPEIEHGRIERTRFASQVLGNERDIYVQLPAGYDDGTASCSLLLLFDGEVAESMLLVPNTLDNLLADGQIPPTVCVMITSDDRSIEYACNEAFASFIAEELVPWARATYRIAEGPDRVTTCGVSYGGLAAAWVALRHPETVGNVISQSGSFQWRWNTGRVGRDMTTVIGDAPPYGWLPAQVAQWDPVPVRFYIEAGRLEARNSHVEPSLLACTRQFRDVLVAKGYDVAYVEYGGGHDYVNWRGSFADAIRHFT